MRYILKNKLTFIILAGCLILTFELLVLGTALVGKKPEITKTPTVKAAEDIVDPIVKQAGRNYEEQKIGDKTYSRKIYTHNISYLASDGSYKTIDTTLKKADKSSEAAKAGYQFENTTNVFGTYFKPNGQADDLIKFQIGNRAVTYSFVGANNVVGKAKDNTFTYPNIYENFDAQYTVNSDQLLEELIAKKEPTTDKITEKISLSGVYFEKQADGSINFLSKETKKLVWRIPRPVMYEKGNVDKASFDLHYEITQEGDYYLLSKVIDQPGQDWLKQATYPVVIDATTTINFTADAPYNNRYIVALSNVSYATAHNATSGSVQTALTYSTLGQQYSASYWYVYRFFLQFDIGQLADNNITNITSAEVGLWGYCGSSCAVTPFNVSVVKGTQTNNPVQSTDFANYDNNAANVFSSINSATGSFQTGTAPANVNHFTFNPTGITYLQNSIAGRVAKFAVVSSRDLSATAPTGNEYVQVYDADYAGTANDPYLQVTYTAPDAPNPVVTYSPTVTGQLQVDIIDNSTDEDYWYLQHSTDGINWSGAYDWCQLPTGTSNNASCSQFGIGLQNASYTCNTTKVGKGASYHCLLTHGTPSNLLSPNALQYYRVKACNNTVGDASYNNCSPWVQTSRYTLTYPSTLAPTLALGDTCSQLKITNLNGVDSSTNPATVTYNIGLTGGGTTYYAYNCTDQTTYVSCSSTTDQTSAFYQTKAAWTNYLISSSKPIIVSGLVPSTSYTAFFMSRNSDSLVNQSIATYSTAVYTRANDLAKPLGSNAAGAGNNTVHLTLVQSSPANPNLTTFYAVRRQKLNTPYPKNPSLSDSLFDPWLYICAYSISKIPSADSGSACETSVDPPLDPNFWGKHATAAPGDLNWGGTGGINISTILNSSPNYNACYRFKSRSENGDSPAVVNSSFSPTTDLICSLMGLTGVDFGTITTTTIQAKAQGTFPQLFQDSCYCISGTEGGCRQCSRITVIETTQSIDPGPQSNENYITFGQNPNGIPPLYALTPNTQYSFQADATNYMGVANSTINGPMTPVTKCTLSNPPTLNAHTGHSQGLGSIDWTWSAPSPIGNCALTYKLYYRQCATYSVGSCSSWASTWSSVANISGTSRTLTGLSNNTLYQVKVTAVNSSGESADSNIQTAYTPIETPTGVSIGSIDASSIALTATGTFTNLDKGSSGIQFSKTGGADTIIDDGFAGAAGQPWIQNTPPTTTDTGLSANVQYCYQAKARNGDGDVTGLSLQGCKYTYAKPPANPRHDAPPVQTTNSMTWRWDRDDGILPLNPAGTKYKARDSKSNYTAWTSDLTSWQVSSYSPNEQITFWVKAQNNQIPTPDDTSEVSHTAYTSQVPPTDLTVSIPTETSDVTSLILSVSHFINNPYTDQSGANFICQSGSCHNKSTTGDYGPSPNTTDTGLAINSQYCYQVQYKNGNGDPTDSYPSSGSVCRYTRARMPSPPDLLRKDASTIKVTINQAGNPATTQFAIKAKYTDAAGKPHEECVNFVTKTLDGSCGTGDIGEPTQPLPPAPAIYWWHTYAEWGGAGGVEVTLPISNINYQFAVKARNNDTPPVETAFSPFATLFLVAKNLVGWTWSANVGWISANCLNLYNRDVNPNFKFGYSCDIAGNWGLNTDYEADRANNINPVTGYAWAGTGQAQTTIQHAMENVSLTNLAAGSGVTGDQYENGPSIALDSNGYPAIAWVEKQGNTGYDIYYIKWNGSDWVTASGVDRDVALDDTDSPDQCPSPSRCNLNVSNAGFPPRNYLSLAPSLALYHDQPYIAFDGGASGSSVFFLKWDPTANSGKGDWVTVTGVDRNTAYNNESTSKLRVDYEYGPSLAVDKNGNPHVAYEKGISGSAEVFYREWNGSNWVTASGASGQGNNDANLNVSNTPSRSSNAKLVMGNESPKQRPHIVWGEDVLGSDAGQIYYRWWDPTHKICSNSGTACSQNSDCTVPSPAGICTNWVDINPNNGINDVQVNKNITGLFTKTPSSWVTTTPPTPPDDNRGGRPSMALYSDNTPGIVWRDYYQIVYRKWNQKLDKWTTVNDDKGGAGNNLRLDDFEYGAGYAVSPMVAIYNDRPYVVFTHSITDGSKGQVYFRRWNDTAWVDQAGNNGSGSGGINVGVLSQPFNPANTEAGSPDIAVDSAGRPQVIWWENPLENPSNGSCTISHCLSDADCPDSGFNQCVYYQGTDKTCANARNQSCTLDTQCPSNPPPQSCNNECNRCSAFDIFYTGWLASSEPTGLGWLTPNINSCSNDNQLACADNSDCKAGTCSVSSAGMPPDSASQYGYCKSDNNTTVPPASNIGDDFRYGKCKSDGTTDCTEPNQATVCTGNGNYCVFYTCQQGGSACPTSPLIPGTKTCRLLSTANFNSATSEVEGWLRSLSLKDYGTPYGYTDWGWAKLSGSYGGLGADKDTVGLWHFTENTGTTARDSSVYRNNGTLVGSPLPQWVTGKFGSALQYDGGDYVDVGNSSLNFNDAITVEAWVKTSDTTNNCPGFNGNCQGIMDKFDGSAGFYFRIWGDNFQFLVKRNGDVINYNVTEPVSSYLGKWTYLAGVVDPSTHKMRLYINGATKPSLETDGYYAPATGNDFLIGRTGGSANNIFWKGQIDDVRITKRALTADEIAAEYKNQGSYLLSGLSVDAQNFLGDPNVDPSKVILYSMFGWAWSGASSPGLGWLEVMPVGALVGIPWLQTLYGDIYGRNGIQLAPAPRGSGLYNATYLIVSGSTITGIPSLYVPNVSGPPTSAGTGQLSPLQENYTNLLPQNVLGKIDVTGLSTLSTDCQDINGSSIDCGNSAAVSGKNKYGYTLATKTVTNINDVNNGIGTTPILNNSIYYFNTGNITPDTYTISQPMTIQNGGIGQSGAGLIIVNGDLNINSNVYYEYGHCKKATGTLCQTNADCNTNVNDSCNQSNVTDIKQLASVAWLVKGNINIAPGVSQLAGVFVSLGTTGSGGIITTSTTDDKATWVPVSIDKNGVARNVTPGKTCSEGGVGSWDNTADPLLFGWDNTNQYAYRTYLRWPLSLPAKAEIKSASIKIFNLSCGPSQFNGRVGVLDKNAIDFTSSPCISYNYDEEKNFSPSSNSSFSIDGIDSLVQRFVDGSDYNPGNYNYIGFEIRRDTNEIQGSQDQFCTFNANSAQLSINYRTSLSVSGAFIAGNYNFNRLYKRGDLPAESVNYDGRVAANTPPGLQDFSSSLPVFQRVTPQNPPL